MASLLSFPVIESQLNLRQPQYGKNKELWEPILDKYNAALAESSSEGELRSLSRHLERGQLLGTCRATIRLDAVLTCRKREIELPFFWTKTRRSLSSEPLQDMDYRNRMLAPTLSQELALSGRLSGFLLLVSWADIFPATGHV